MEFHHIYQCGHKPEKHGKPGKLREFEKLLKYQGKLREIRTFCRKTWKTQGKCIICDIIRNNNVFQRIFLSSCSEKKSKMPSKSQGKLREFSFSKMWPPCLYKIITLIIVKTYLQTGRRRYRIAPRPVVKAD